MKKFLFAIIILFPVVIFFVFPKWTVDDAYIYFRYADNLAKRGELNWNVGEAPVEGYTGIAWPIMLAGFIRLWASPIIVSQTLGFIFYFVGLLFLYLILRKLNLGVAGRLLGLAFYIFTPVLFTHTFSGLETMMFFSLLFVGFYGCLTILDEDDPRVGRKEIIFCFALLLISLTRPEGVVLSFCFLLAVCYVKCRQSLVVLKSFLFRFFIFYFLPALVYFIWRFDYYGHLLPNTFYAKTIGVGFHLANILDLFRLLRRYFVAPFLACMLLLAADTDNLWKKMNVGETVFVRRKELIAVFAYWFFIILLLVQYSRSHLTMNYAHRFYLPVLPAIWITLAVIFDRCWVSLRLIKNTRPLAYGLIIVLAALLFAYQFSFYIAKLKDEFVFAKDYGFILKTEHVAIGKLLKGIVPENEWMVVYIDAGAMPYFSGLKTIDFGGLNDITLSRGKLSEKERVDYLFSVNPGAVVFTSVSSDELELGPEPERIILDQRFQNYVLYKKFLSTLPGSSDYHSYHEFLYLRDDLAAGVLSDGVPIE